MVPASQHFEKCLFGNTADNRFFIDNRPIALSPSFLYNVFDLINSNVGSRL